MKYKISVSGAAETGHCLTGCLEKAKELGCEIIRQNGILVTGATSGVPYWSAIGAKEEGGMVIGFSPASSPASHRKTYRLPTDYHDLIIYTGFEYSGRNLLLTRSSDAVIVICGRIGTLNEFTIAFEDKKPIGILIETGGTADMIKDILRKSHRGPGKTVFDPDPKKLVSKVIKLIEKEKNR
ncbi:LOG family protein [Patescibacteria group bacterium]|nr:LOG family protein [Patescibacteria group bacterium]MBU3923011.1 LOG family protein [Patescibacteria group bacterium]